MENKRVKVYAPATIANLGAGFDVLGVALETPGDFVSARRTKMDSFNFSIETTLHNIPTAVDKNIAAYVAGLMIQELKPAFGIDMILYKKMPIGSGIGSSGASCVAAAVAVNALLNKPLHKRDLLPFVVEGERKASGAAHADNVAPALFGGACIIRNEKPLDVISFPVHPSLVWIVITPHLSIATANARRLLPNTVPLTDVTRQMGNISGLVVGLMQGDAAIISNCMTDHIAEPVRHTLIPGFTEVKQTALAAGALGCGISGSGPAIFAVALSTAAAKEIARQMIATLLKVTGVHAESYISLTNAIGANMVTETAV